MSDSPLLRITRSGDTLTAAYNGIVTPLEHWHYDVWSGTKVDDPTFKNLKLKFDTDFDGNIAAVEAPFEPAVAAVRFVRKPDAKYSDPAYLTRLTGRYLLGPTPATIDLRGNHLTVSLPGQPAYDLVPAVDGWFDLKGLAGFRVQFDGDTMRMSQPNGLYEAKRQ
jgi:hypothetical protein